MKINKMVFSERENFDNKDYELLDNMGIITFTDYDNREISSYTVRHLSDDFDEDEVNNIIEILNNGLGTDVVELLLNGQIDFVQIIY